MIIDIQLGTRGLADLRGRMRSTLSPYLVTRRRQNQAGKPANTEFVIYDQSIDVTYIRLARGIVYLEAVIDWYSGRVLSWRISNSMDASFCVDCMKDALRVHGKPETFNSDQGSQFTSHAITGVLKWEGIAISMDGRGRALDNIFVERLWRNVKYEDVCLQGYGTMGELTVGLARYFAFYNGERPHQSVGKRTPMRCTSAGKVAARKSWTNSAARGSREALFCCK